MISFRFQFQLLILIGSLCFISCDKQEIDSLLPEPSSSEVQYFSTNSVGDECSTSDCQEVIMRTKRAYQALANQQNRILYIPEQCCMDGKIVYLLVKVNPQEQKKYEKF